MAKKTKYDRIVDTYRGEIPRAVVLGIMQAESGMKERALNRAPDAPGGGPKVGLMQPSRAGLKDAMNVDTVQVAFLQNPVNNIRVGATILNHYWARLRQDYPGKFQPLDADANAVAVLAVAYTFGYAYLKRLLDAAGTSYREIANRFASDPVIARKWGDRVIAAASRYGYQQVLSGGGALMPTPGPLPGPTPGPSPTPGPTPAKKGSPLPWILGAAAMGGLVLVATRKKKR